MKFKKMIMCLGLLLVAASAMACPKGEHPHGGVGSHHKGGYCSYDQ